MQLYFKVAKAARAKYPDIKLVWPGSGKRMAMVQLGLVAVKSTENHIAGLNFSSNELPMKKKQVAYDCLMYLIFIIIPDLLMRPKYTVSPRIF